MLLILGVVILFGGWALADQRFNRDHDWHVAGWYLWGGYAAMCGCFLLWCLTILKG